jgi:hypothetical protein
MQTKRCNLRHPKAFYFDRTSPATVAMAEWAKANDAFVFLSRRRLEKTLYSNAL